MTVADRQKLDEWSDIVGHADAATIARHRERWRTEIEFIFSVQLDTPPDYEFRAVGVSRLRPAAASRPSDTEAMLPRDRRDVPEDDDSPQERHER